MTDSHDTVLIALGMHGGLRLTGADAAAVATLNERMLQALGSAWDDVRPLPEEWWRGGAVAPFRREIAEFARARAGHGTWTLADPRLYRLLPLWRTVLAECGCRVVAALVVDDPRDVAAALQRAHGIASARGQLLWLSHLLAGEQGTRGLPRVIVAAQELRADAAATRARLGVALGITWPAVHAGAATDDEVFAGDPPRLIPQVDDAYRALVALAAGRESAAASERLEQIGREFAAAQSLFKPVLDEARQELVAQMARATGLRGRVQAQAQTHRRALAARESAYEDKLETLAEECEGAQRFLGSAVRDLQAALTEARASGRALSAALERGRAPLWRRMHAAIARRLRGRAPAAADSFLCYLDQPEVAVVRENEGFEIVGWCLASSGASPAQLRVRAGEVLFVGVYGLLRADVARAYPDVAGAERSGFRVAAALPQGTQELEFEVKIGDEWRCALRTPITVLPRETPGHLPKLDATILLAVDSPPGWDVERDDRGGFDIFGWCVNANGRRVRGVRAVIDGVVFEGEYGIRRPDVVPLLAAKGCSLHGASPRCGFRIRVQVAPGRHRLALEACDAAGKWTEVDAHELTVHAATAGGTGGAAPGSPLPGSEQAQAARKWYEAVRCAPAALEAQRREAATWVDPPLISIVVPCYDSRAAWLSELLASVQAQSYPRWECLIVDDASAAAAHLKVARGWCAQDARFRLMQRESNGGVGAASQTGLEQATGDYLCVADHDDILEPDALYELARAIRTLRPDVVYSDEMLVREDGAVIACTFRPAFNYALLLSHPYIVHLTAFRRAVLLAAGGFDSAFSVSQDYDAVLRVAARTRAFHHVPKVLYRWRTYSRSTGHQQLERVATHSLAAIDRHLQRSGRDAHEAWAEEGPVFNVFRVRRAIAPVTVSVIVPFRGAPEQLRACIDSVWSDTRIPGGVTLEVVIADRGSADPDARAVLKELQRSGHEVLALPGAANDAALRNRAAAQAGGALLLFLDSDVTIADPDWLEAMLESMSDADVGIVGAKLIDPLSGEIRHAGLILGYDGAVGVDHARIAERANGHPTPGYNQALVAVRDCAAVSATAMLVRRSAFAETGGFDAHLTGALGDADLCLRIHAHGHRCVFTPYARLYQHGAATTAFGSAEKERFGARWRAARDPFYNVNLSLRRGRMYEPRETDE